MYSVRVMISLFTRVMISSTTVSPGETEGSNSAYPTANSRGILVIFFMRALLKPGVTPRENFVALFYAASGMEANLNGWVGWLGGSFERQSGHVVVLRSHAHELLDALQDALGKILGRSRPRLPHALHPLQANFRVLTLPPHYAAGDPRHRATRSNWPP